MTLVLFFRKVDFRSSSSAGLNDLACGPTDFERTGEHRLVLEEDTELAAVEASSSRLLSSLLTRSGDGDLDGDNGQACPFDAICALRSFTFDVVFIGTEV